MVPASLQLKSYRNQYWLFYSFLGLGACFCLCCTSVAQDTDNLVPNGDMEQVQEVINLWDGVGPDDTLQGFQYELPAMTKAGVTKPAVVPPSVVAGEMTGDALLDLLVADTQGYFWLYENIGTSSEPQFAHGEIHSVFLSRGGQRCGIAGFYATDSRDLLVGSYTGELLLLQDTRQRDDLNWAQPAALDEAMISTDSRDRLWGNLLAPAAADFNNDGHLDLLLGDGSYSANTVRLYINQGTNISPLYNEQQRYDLIQGDGREQLVPAIIDVNSDNYPDLLVADSNGWVTLHLHPGSDWQPGTQWPLSKFLLDSSSPLFGQALTVSAADMNADSTFDLLLGKPNGSISMAINAGSNSVPQFPEIVDLVGTQVGPEFFYPPDSWQTSTNGHNANAYAYFSTAGSSQYGLQPVTGNNMLIAGYLTPKLVRLPAFDYTLNGARTTNESLEFRCESQVQLKNNQIYQLSFHAAGMQVIQAGWEVTLELTKQIGETRFDRQDRGIVNKLADIRSETFTESGIFSPREDWLETRASFTVRFKDQDLRAVEDLPPTTLAFVFTLEPGAGKLFIDNVQLVEQ